MVGNVPFADLKLDYHGQKLSLHDYFFAKSVDALKPGGVLALVTSHFTLDKQNAAIREYLAAKADFVGAIRLPSDAFKREGTAVVTDIVFLRKRAPGRTGQSCRSRLAGRRPACDRWRRGSGQPLLPEPSRNGPWHTGPARTRSMAAKATASLGNGDLAGQLKDAIHRLPAIRAAAGIANRPKHPAPVFTPPPPERHIGEGSFFVGDDRIDLSIAGRTRRAGRLWRHDAQGRRHADRQTPGRPDRAARPCPPRAAIAERRLARSKPQRGTPRTQSGL